MLFIRCRGRSSMKNLWIALVLSALGPFALSQNLFDTAAGWLRTPLQTPGATHNVDLVHLDTKPTTSYRPGFFKKLTIESFGYSLGPQAPGFAFSPGYTASLFNLHGLECPRCILGPVNRARFTLPPFGANAVLKLLDGRVELFSGFGGLEAFKPEGTLEPRGHQLWTSYYGDAWLVQAEGGGRVALDRDGHIWLGATSRHLWNFGSGPQQWSTFSGNATFRFGR